MNLMQTCVTNFFHIKSKTSKVFKKLIFSRNNGEKKTKTNKIFYVLFKKKKKLI